ncbi:MAG: hypothetical protein E3J23_08485 [Candidatus Stahlbacteria bacterium]|nr:MAG: hypothetical protein E3J23_08485 [Candidatus Stahlbacteria bacterium]
MNDKLRECPRCGSKAILKSANEDNRRQTNQIECTNKPCITLTRAAMHGEEDIIKLWNTRHEPTHETVDQWEERTGESYPDDGPVWGLYHNDMKSTKKWKLYEHKKAIYNFTVSKCIVATHHGKPEKNNDSRN